MNKPEWINKTNVVLAFKVIWWLTLITILTSFLRTRYSAIIEGNGKAIDIFVFLVWCALILVPLFNEVEFFGIKLKREIEELKSEVKEQLVNLRSEVQNSIQLQSHFNPQIYLGSGTPPPDSQLPELKDYFSKVLEDTLKKEGVSRPVDTTKELDVSDDTIFLFTVRYVIEKELRRIHNQIHNQMVSIQQEKRPVPVHQITRNLVQAGLLDSRLAQVVRDVYSVCSLAIHGEEVSQEKVRFVRDIAPGLITSLKAIW